MHLLCLCLFFSLLLDCSPFHLVDGELLLIQNLVQMSYCLLPCPLLHLRQSCFLCELGYILHMPLAGCILVGSSWHLHLSAFSTRQASPGEEVLLTFLTLVHGAVLA